MAEFTQIDAYCKLKDIVWFFSAWDLDSQLLMRQFECKFNKVASARISHMSLIEAIAQEKKHTFISTGMATDEEVDNVVELFRKHNCPFEIMHCVSTYPSKIEDLNLRCIHTLADKYSCKIGYSGHETGLATSVAAAAIGASSIERHLTLDRAMYGSDQAASVEPQGFKRMIRDIRVVELAMGDGIKKILEAEKPIAAKLKRTEDL